MIQHTALRYGPEARNRLVEATTPTIEGAYAALESFYYAFNQRDGDVLREVWAQHPLAQLNNPLGGILRGGDKVAELYEKVFHGSARVEVTFGDIVEYSDERHAVFAGRETGSYTGADGDTIALEIRTTRYFRYDEGRWRQYHHHGSIDAPDALGAYQRAVTG
ncbi:hypothetical protein GCM10012275_15780 [Longimycelium tulufanense]|uniref:SnoaL-like domain-containing protein n=1 Tax=Longimycelium tulufanense TaxID=907463 RepID=A0A8J3CCD4_9PSEU|nr:nuclear transport factor 2 family protein [Longimycelium tulufanense]GGM45570.1 hypothetical protein GCM10012275_15780 [Longimycelium tulufanense]